MPTYKVFTVPMVELMEEVMKEYLIDKIKRWLRLWCSDMCGHSYGCCNKITKNCVKCIKENGWEE